MATDIQNQTIFVNTILNLRQRGVIQDLPPSLSHHYSTPQIDNLRGNHTQKTKETTFSYSGWNQRNIYQDTRNEISQNSINCTNAMYPYKNTKSTEFLLNTDKQYSVNTLIGTQCSTPLRQSDYIYQPIDSNIATNKELNTTQSSFDSLHIEENEGTHLVESEMESDVAPTTLQPNIHRYNYVPLPKDEEQFPESVKNEIPHTEETFDCFPSGFESYSPRDSTNDVGTYILQPVEEPIVKETNTQFKNKPKFKVPIKSTLQDSEEIIGDDSIQTISEPIHPTSSEEMLLNNQDGYPNCEELNESGSAVCMEIEPSDIMVHNQLSEVNTGLSKSKKRGTKRPGEWMVSEDKKGAVLAYEQEHNLIPDTNNSTEMSVNPNTQELHESLQCRSSISDTVDTKCTILHEMSMEERNTLKSLAILSSHCYLTLIFSDGSSQLREMTRDKNNTAQIEGVMIALQTNGADQENLNHVFLSFSDPREEYISYCRDLLHTLFLSEVVCCVCFDAQELLISLIGYLSIPCHSVYAGWSVMDLKVAGWLLDSDHPPESFLQLQQRYSLKQQDLSVQSHTSARSNAFTRAITDLGKLEKVYGSMRGDLVRENQFELFAELESRVAPILAVMEGEGLGVEQGNITEMKQVLNKQIECIEREAHTLAQRPFQLTSPVQVREILFDWLQLDKKCGKSLYLTQKQRAKSTSEQVLESLRSTHPLPGLILQHRRLSKLLSFLHSLLPLIKQPASRLYPCWQQTGAATGRLSCNCPNLQAVPKKSVQLEDTGRELYIRSIFTSREGHTLLSVDFRSIELRIVAFLSGEASLCSVFTSKNTDSTKDIFTQLTADWQCIPYETVSVTDRESTKRMVYGLIYGIGKDKLSEYLMKTPTEAQERMDDFSRKFPKVKLFMNTIKRSCHTTGYVTTQLNRRRNLSHVKAENYQTRMYAERQAVNFVVQGLAADICKVAMIKICNRISETVGLNAKLLIQIHDELLFEVPDTEMGDTVGIVCGILETDRLLEGYTELRLPLEVKILAGKNWGDMQEIASRKT